MINFRSKARKGFTFLEIMMVVVIIGILMSIAIPRFAGRSERAKDRAVRMQIKHFQTALGQYEMDTGSFPSTSDGLKALVERPSEVSEEDWDGPYIEAIPRDLWHEEYVYKCPGDNSPDYDLYSKGKDREEGTEDDITSWAKAEDSQ